MSRARVLLVDDDASIRRFVALALEDLDVELIDAGSVPQAREALRGAPFQLIITDLMMPGETGFDLLQHLADHPSRRAGARLAVFSAGIRGETQAQLDAFGVWRRLPKPTSLTELQQCVRDAVSAGGSPGTASGAPAARPAAASPADALTPAESAAIARHFGGDRSLFLAYRSSCLAQFGADLRTGDDASARGDATALRHLAHSLKSVLATLGRADAGITARALEDAAAHGDGPACRALWKQLREQMTPPA